MKKASIIVPVYNIERYIRGCVESLQAQTEKNIEILLVDDGGTDKSGEICEEYACADKRIQVFHKENGGISDARNYGARQAKGEYLFFIDGDDSVVPHLVEKTVACADKLQADMVFFDFESIEEETGRRDLYHYGMPENKVFSARTNPEVLLKSPSACCCLYRKKFWDKSGIRYPKGRHYEDLATTPRFLLQAERIGYVGDEPFYYYMLRKGSIMHSSNFERSYEDRTWVLEFLRDYFSQKERAGEFQKELEYMFFEHGYFVPSKEIILENSKSIWLKKFRIYVEEKYPGFLQNPYIKTLSKKDKILLFLMKRHLYGIMNILSGLRKKSDSLRQ